MAVYQFGGLAPFYFRGDPEDFINAGNLVDAMMVARRAFRHATWRGDFGAALAAEMQADAASAELTVLFGELLTKHMEPIDEGTIRDAIAGLRRESDEELAHDQAAA